jgi:hypothetical protein
MFTDCIENYENEAGWLKQEPRESQLKVGFIWQRNGSVTKTKFLKNKTEVLGKVSAGYK